MDTAAAPAETTTEPANERMRAGLERLRTASHPAIKIHVFGSVRCNVHVTCASRTAAEKWRMALARIGFDGLRVWESAIDKATNTNTMLRPSQRTVWMVGGAL